MQMDTKGLSHPCLEETHAAPTQRFPPNQTPSPDLEPSLKELTHVESSVESVFKFLFEHNRTESCVWAAPIFLKNQTKGKTKENKSTPKFFWE